MQDRKFGLDLANEVFMNLSFQQLKNGNKYVQHVIGMDGLVDVNEDRATSVYLWGPWANWVTREVNRSIERSLGLGGGLS